MMGFYLDIETSKVLHKVLKELFVSYPLEFSDYEKSVVENVIDYFDRYLKL